MRTVGRDRVAGKKFTERFVQDAAIRQFKSAIGADRFHGDEFTVGYTPTGRQLAIGLEKQPVTICDRKLARLADREAVEQSVRDRHELSADFDKHARFQNANKFAFRARCGIADLLIEGDDGLWRIETLIAFLRVGEVNSFQCLNRGSKFF